MNIAFTGTNTCYVPQFDSSGKNLWLIPEESPDCKLDNEQPTALNAYEKRMKKTYVFTFSAARAPEIFKKTTEKHVFSTIPTVTFPS